MPRSFYPHGKGPDVVKTIPPGIEPLSNYSHITTVQTELSQLHAPDSLFHRTRAFGLESNGNLLQTTLSSLIEPSSFHTSRFYSRE
jgi:hypothetical protein